MLRILFSELVLGATLAAQSGLSPSISPGGVVSSADYSSGESVGIPRGSLFTIFGRDLAPGQTHAGGLPLPTILNQVRVKIWASALATGAFTEAPLLYVSPGQINAVLPSSVSEGQKAVTVRVGESESSGYPFTVIGARFAAFTRGGLGFGPAVLQQYDESGQVSLNRLLNPARPGQTMVLWGTGLAAVRADPPPGSADPAGGDSEVTAYIAGVPVRPLYAGPAPGLPGVDQINFVLPAGLPDRCFLPFLVRTGQRDSGVLTLSHASTGAECRSEFGLSTAALDLLDRGAAVRGAVLSFVSDTAQQVGQTIEAWLAEYDAPRLSVLATSDLRPGAQGDAGCISRTYSYTRYQSPPLSPSASVYGLRVIPGGLAVSITGTTGCTWSLSPSLDGILRTPAFPPCLAAAYSFRGGAGAPFAVTGTFPEPRPRNVIAQFGIEESGGQMRASWRIVGLTAADQLSLKATSSFTLHGNIFSGLTTVNELVCRAAPADGFLLFPPSARWALGLPDGGHVLMNLAAVSHQVIPADESETSPRGVDFVLVRIRNGASARAQPP